MLHSPLIISLIICFRTAKRVFECVVRADDGKDTMRSTVAKEFLQQSNKATQVIQVDPFQEQ